MKSTATNPFGPSGNCAITTAKATGVPRQFHRISIPS